MQSERNQSQQLVLLCLPPPGPSLCRYIQGNSRRFWVGSVLMCFCIVLHWLVCYGIMDVRVYVRVCALLES